ncbi:hypothetical protein M0R88_15965 [Halorussus gelatinilyticus]|uniref:HTH iclR-type domain-containing protein n=1 Tax=Halorussus gelatinilyticus TaxID=2937524 RepID=A0A8U0IGI8_9EURY|nr:hypothetical protein [Halorussus gelatinilyticus]UPV99997.1 hypothetical protein M0R88_15965 [Halorussus gelatinilyticus]
MRRLLAVGLVVVLLVGTVPVAPVLGVLPARDATSVSTMPSTEVRDGPSTELSRTPQTLGVAENFDTVEFHITVHENGTAEWTFTYQRTLNNDTERRQFQQFASEFNNNSTRLYENFKRQARQLASAGQNATGRAMKAQHFHKEAYVGGLVNENRGIVKMSFQWTSFATAEGETVIIGDVFEGGLYIGPNQSLVVHTGTGLQFQSAQPSASAQPSGDSLVASESVTWQGEHDFIDQRPRVKFEPVEGTTTTTTAETTNSGGGNATVTTRPAGQPPSDGGGGWSLLMMFIGAVVVLLGLAAAFAYRQGDFGSFAGSTDRPDGGDGGGGAAAAGNGGTTASEPSVSDEELLTDEARVKKLLDENGGRMKQVNIVEETGWSKSKVSMLLSEMEEEGDISKLRVGRENIISLEGHEPDAAGSPLEGE